MNCPECKAKMGTMRADHQYRECGLDNVWLEDWPTMVCPNEHMKLPILPDARLLAIAITHALITHVGKLSGDEVFFLRKAMRMTAAILAQALDVDRVSVSRWENGKVPINEFSDFRLRMEAIEKVIPAEQQRDVRDEVVAMLHRRYRPEVLNFPIKVPESLVPEAWMINDLGKFGKPNCVSSN